MAACPNFYSLFKTTGNYNSFFVGDSSAVKTKYSRRISISMEDKNGNLVSSKNNAYRLHVQSIVSWDGIYRTATHDAATNQCTLANKCLFIDSYLTTTMANSPVASACGTVASEPMVSAGTLDISSPGLCADGNTASAFFEDINAWRVDWQCTGTDGSAPVSCMVYTD
jgi:hypothetical protein